MAKGLCTMYLSFKDSSLIHFGGMINLQHFCNKLRLSWLIQNTESFNLPEWATIPKTKTMFLSPLTLFRGPPPGILACLLTAWKCRHGHRDIFFIKVALSKVPRYTTRSRIRFRADAGFLNKKVIEFLDQEGCGYVIVDKLYLTIKFRALGCRFQKL